MLISGFQYWGSYNMKKFVIITIILLTIFCSGCVPKDNSPYPNGGRDTYDQFGNRRFVLLSGGGLTLYDRKTDSTIDYDVYDYIDREPYVYIYGSEGYTRLNYETGDYSQSKDIDRFKEEDKTILKGLKREKPDK